MDKSIEQRRTETTKEILEEETALRNKIGGEMVALAEIVEAANKTGDVDADILEKSITDLLVDRMSFMRNKSDGAEGVRAELESLPMEARNSLTKGHEGDLLMVDFSEESERSYHAYVDSFLILILTRFVFQLLKTSDELDNIRSVMKSLAPGIEKLRHLIEQRENESQTVKDIVESLWSNLVKRGAVI